MAMEAVEDYTEGNISITPDYIYEDPGSFCEKSSVREFAKYFLTLIYCCVFFLGITGNGLVVLIYIHYKKMKTMTDVYLLNLAIADILFLLTLPFWAIAASHHWVFKTATCKIVTSMYRINFYSGMLLLACISVDRYIAIVQAMKAQNYKPKRFFYSKLICLGVWLLAIALSIPEFMYSTETSSIVFGAGTSVKSCTMVYPSDLSQSLKVSVLILRLTMGFGIPVVVMICCYAVVIKTLLQAKSFEKHKALKVIFSVMAVFVLSQLPYNSILVLQTLDAANLTAPDCDMAKKIDIATQVTQSMAFLHSCLNPFLYVFIGVRFRHDVLKMLKKLGCISQANWAKYIKSEWSVKRYSGILETRSSGTLSL
ncbi:C-C chemokine receptor type 9 [Rhinatrema bivittatum]|uniref:C-C chemokine receptor type 9 n=1 Tax=Rhinatrema bivittatum TaxID=194408 RepID=UPI00112B726F|nr:C-C chemokine receptor type 9 [Rhinatrema bivittatum]XP_029445317.1 C-C chemokine receptor type 9 [Rhinatrema bivittatum]